MNTHLAAAEQTLTGRSVFTGHLVHQLAGLEMTTAARPPRFDDPVWDLSGIANTAAQLKPSQLMFDFTSIPNPAWQLVARELMIALLCPTHPQVATLAMARRCTPTPAGPGYSISSAG